MPPSCILCSSSFVQASDPQPLQQETINDERDQDRKPAVRIRHGRHRRARPPLSRRGLPQHGLAHAPGCHDQLGRGGDRHRALGDLQQRYASPLPLALVGLLVAVFLSIEARRYRFFDFWRMRAHVLELQFFGPILRGQGIRVDNGWNEILYHDYIHPTCTSAYAEAVGRRLRRNYGWIFAIQVVAYVGKLLIHPTPIAHISASSGRAPPSGPSRVSWYSWPDRFSTPPGSQSPSSPTGAEGVRDAVTRRAPGSIDCSSSRGEGIRATKRSALKSAIRANLEAIRLLYPALRAQACTANVIGSGFNDDCSCSRGILETEAISDDLVLHLQRRVVRLSPLGFGSASLPALTVPLTLIATGLPANSGSWHRRSISWGMTGAAGTSFGSQWSVQV